MGLVLFELDEDCPVVDAGGEVMVADLNYLSEGLAVGPCDEYVAHNVGVLWGASARDHKGDKNSGSEK